MQEVKSYLVMLPEAIPPLQLSKYDEIHPDMRNSFTRSVDTIALSRHQVHVATKQILFLQTQIVELQQQLLQHEEKYVYLHNQTMSLMAHRAIDAERHAFDERRIKDAEDRIVHVTQFDSCRKCNATCTRFKNMCRPCTRACVKERSEKAKLVVEEKAKEPAIVPLSPKSKKQQKKPKTPRIVESEWSRDIPMKLEQEQESAPDGTTTVTEKSASGRRVRYTLMYL